MRAGRKCGVIEVMAIFARCLALFAYIDKEPLEGGASFQGTSSVKGRLRMVEEQWMFAFDPAALPA